MTVINLAEDPYGRRSYAHKKRGEFEKLKRTQEFKIWKDHQIKKQRNRCAYCEVKLSKENIVTHVDHIEPLYHEGTNNFDNLVLACRRCNIRKWTSNKYVKPKWIADREAQYAKRLRLEAIKDDQRRLMRELVRAELDEQALEFIRSWA